MSPVKGPRSAIKSDASMERVLAPGNVFEQYCGQSQGPLRCSQAKDGVVASWGAYAPRLCLAIRNVVTLRGSCEGPKIDNWCHTKGVREGGFCGNPDVCLTLCLRGLMALRLQCYGRNLLGRAVISSTRLPV